MGLGVFWPLAIASKENGILVPVLVVVVELFFFSGARSPEIRPPGPWSPWQLSIGAAVLIGAVIVITAPSGIFAGYAYRPSPCGSAS